MTNIVDPNEGVVDGLGIEQDRGKDNGIDSEALTTTAEENDSGATEEQKDVEMEAEHQEKWSATVSFRAY